MNEILQAWRSVDRNIVAAILSVVPGLGHLYKHHYVAGFGLMAGSFLVVFIAALLGMATFGFGLLVIPAYFLGVAAGAYTAPDWHGHHAYLHAGHWRAKWNHEPAKPQFESEGAE